MGTYETITKLEALRKKMSTIHILMAAPLIFMIFFGMKNPGIEMMLFLVYALILLVMTKYIMSLNKEYKELYKQTFVAEVLTKEFDNVMYVWQEGFQEAYVRSFNVVKLGNRYSTEDYLSASYKGVHFEQADVTIKYHSSSGKHSHTTTYFKGRMFVFDFPNKNVASVRCFSSNFMYRASTKNQKIEMESVDFNKDFDVDAFYDHDAFYLLTPQLMNRITYLKSQYGNVAVILTGNKLMVAINMSSDAFDHVSINKKIDYPSEVEKIKKDVQVIKDIVDILAIY